MVLRGYVGEYQERANRPKKKRSPHWSICSLWLQKDPDIKGHLIIDEEAAQVVREDFYTVFHKAMAKLPLPVY